MSDSDHDAAPDVSIDDAPVIESSSLRSALEYAVLIAEETQKRKPPMAVPNELRPFFGKRRIPTGALSRVRRAVESDDVFRRRIAAGASPELVDDVGRLWLQRPPNWHADVAAKVSEASRRSSEADAATTLRKAERRRAAAEEAATRARAENIRLAAIIDDQRVRLDARQAELAVATDELVQLRSELATTRTEARHARDREVAANARLSSWADRLALEAPDVAADAPAEPDARSGPTDADLEHLRTLAQAAADAATDATRFLDSFAVSGVRPATGADDDSSPAAGSPPGGATPSPSRAPGRSPGRRQPLRLPGGVVNSSPEAAHFLVRSGAAVVVDGYNVAKLGWPTLPLIDQRAALLEAVENLTRRFGSDITVVFDGADVVGAHRTRRQQVRVMYSPAGVSADDVIRSEVRRIWSARGVVVVTNDAAIVRDVKVDGANVLTSDSLLGLF